MLKKYSLLCIYLQLLLLGSVLQASATSRLTVPSLYSSHMVIQRGVPFTIKGQAVPNSQIKLELSCSGQREIKRYSARSDESGRWEMTLGSFEADGLVREIEISCGESDESQLLEDIVVGDVWLFSGQSNMEKKVKHLHESLEVVSAAKRLKEIRAWRISHRDAEAPLDEIVKSYGWSSCADEDFLLSQVSAVAYSCAKRMYESQRIPIGILQSYRGGTEIETWISHAKFDNDARLSHSKQRYLDGETSNYRNHHSGQFNGMIAPLCDFPIAGVFWYQGESNTKRAYEYALFMEALIEDWRAHWGLREIPFYYVQLFNIGSKDPKSRDFYPSRWADLRDEQRRLLDQGIPNIAMAVSIDTNEIPNHPDVSQRIHPHNKWPIGQRLAGLALKHHYAEDIKADHPLYRNFVVDGERIIVTFENCYEGLRVNGGQASLKGFVIAGSDQQFLPAIKAQIIGPNQIALSNPAIDRPVAVRYAWARNPDCNLANSVGLPASPFRTDDFDIKPLDGGY